MELHGAFSISLRAPGTEALSRFGYLAGRVVQELLWGRCGVSPQRGWRKSGPVLLARAFCRQGETSVRLDAV
jgi:hypothetical protein